MSPRCTPPHLLEGSVPWTDDGPTRAQMEDRLRAFAEKYADGLDLVARHLPTDEEAAPLYEKESEVRSLAPPKMPWG